MSELRIPFVLTEAAPVDWNLREPVSKAHADDAAYDLHAVEDVYLMPGDRKLVNTGIAVAIPEGYAGLVLPRSGLSLDYITVANAPGLIDPGYRGDVGVILYRMPSFGDLIGNAKDYYHIKAGDRIAQLLFIKTADVELSHAAWLPRSERADAGFGSTGR